MTGIEKTRLLNYRLKTGFNSRSHFQPSSLYEQLLPVSDTFLKEQTAIIPVYVLSFFELIYTKNIIVFNKNNEESTIFLKRQINKEKDGCFYNVAIKAIFENLKISVTVSDLNLISYFLDKELYVIFNYKIDSDQYMIPNEEIESVCLLKNYEQEKIDELSKKFLKEGFLC